MRRLRHIFVGIALSLGSTSPLSAEDITIGFPALWQEFLGSCGAVVANPAAMESNLATLSTLPVRAFAKSSAQNGLVLNAFSADYMAATYVHLVNTSRGHWIECEISREFTGHGQSSQMSRTITEMLNASGQMTATTGDMVDLPMSNVSMAEVGDGPWSVVLVEGVFPGRPITTLVDVEGTGVTIRVTGNLP